MDSSGGVEVLSTVEGAGLFQKPNNNAAIVPNKKVSGSMSNSGGKNAGRDSKPAHTNPSHTASEAKISFTVVRNRDMISLVAFPGQKKGGFWERACLNGKFFTIESQSIISVAYFCSQIY